MFAWLRKLFGGSERPQQAGKGDPLAIVRYVSERLVDAPHDVKVTSEQDEQGLVIRIACADGQVGRIIGRKGRTIRAIRALARAATAPGEPQASVVVAD
jgi:predicted RNA-binding protein YlqC (UPF0109 family)